MLGSHQLPNLTYCTCTCCSLTARGVVILKLCVGLKEQVLLASYLSLLYRVATYCSLYTGINSLELIKGISVCFTTFTTNLIIYLCTY